MKLYIIVLLFLIPIHVFAVSNLKLNGTDNLVIETLPADVTLTCDLAAQGNNCQLEIFLDLNSNNVLEASDPLIAYTIIVDGIPWIINPDDPEEYIMGDENGLDGTLQTTYKFLNRVIISTQGQLFFKVTDKDGSSEYLQLTVDIPATPPTISGKVTSSETGTPLSNIFVIANASNDDIDQGAITDENGDYILNVMPDTYEISAYAITDFSYKEFENAVVTVEENETRTFNIEMESLTSFIDGYVLEDDSPVANTAIYIESLDENEFTSYLGFTNQDGYFKIGVAPDDYSVSAPGYAQSRLFESLYIEPIADTVTVGSGQTVTSNFTALPYNSFITGVCLTSDGNPVPGIDIYGASLVTIPSPPYVKPYFFSTFSKADGSYKLGVTIDSLSALYVDSYGYSLIDPQQGYQNIYIPGGSTETGYDFEFSPNKEAVYITGRVTYKDGTAAQGVYVIAHSDLIASQNGHIIQQTDANGNFRFENLEEEDWRVGVYKKGYKSEPAIVSGYIEMGNPLEDVHFVLEQTENTGVETGVTPNVFALDQNYPNPFNLNVTGNTSIRLNLDKTENVTLSIINIRGQLVRQINMGRLSRGSHIIQWNGRGLNDNLVPSGIYFYRVKVGDQNLTRQMTIIR